MRNEKRAAVSLVNPTNNPPVIVTPDRDAPGTKENTWANPIRRESLMVISFISFLKDAAFSAIASRTAKNRMLPVITYKFLVSGPSINSFK